MASGIGEQLEDDLGDDAERPFAAAEQLGQVVPDHPLVGLAAGADDGAGREHHLQPHDEILGAAVLHRPGATGVFCHVPPQGGELERGRIGWVEQTQFLNRLLELFGDNPRLDLGNQVFGVDAQNAVHAGCYQHDAACLGQGAARESAPRATGKNRETAKIGKPENGGNLFRVGRVHDRIRQIFHLGGVVGITEQILPVGCDIPGPYY